MVDGKDLLLQFHICCEGFGGSAASLQLCGKRISPKIIPEYQLHFCWLNELRRNG